MATSAGITGASEGAAQARWVMEAAITARMMFFKGGPSLLILLDGNALQKG